MENSPPLPVDIPNHFLHPAEYFVTGTPPPTPPSTQLHAENSAHPNGIVCFAFSEVTTASPHSKSPHSIVTHSQRPVFSEHTFVQQNVAPPSEQTLTHSENVHSFMGKHVPHNTKRATRTSNSRFADFVTSIPSVREEAFAGEEHMPGMIMSDKDLKMQWALEETRRILFRDANFQFFLPGFSEWIDSQLKKIRHFLIQHAVNYKSPVTGREFTANTMRSYILGVQRGFLDLWDYNLKLPKGPIFECKKEGLMAVLDNRFREQQSRGLLVKSHNVLTRDQLERLYSCSSLSRQTLIGFQSRMILNVALINMMRQSALWGLTTNQFEKVDIDGTMLWKIKITARMAYPNGATKTNQGGWKAVSMKPVEICVFDEDSLSGTLNIYTDLSDYIRFHMALHLDDPQPDERKRFFLAVNHKATRCNEFFKRQNLGKNSFMRIVKTVCANEGITGIGAQDVMTTHGIRGTTTTLLVDGGHADSSIPMHTGCRTALSLKNYETLRVNVVRNQQRAILGTASEDQSEKRCCQAFNDGSVKRSLVDRNVVQT